MAQEEQLGPYCYRAPDGVFPLGQESLLLSAFPRLRRGMRVCELGCGGGAVLLLLLAREETLRLSGVELDPCAARCARENLAANGLSGEVLAGDLRHVRALLPAGGFDLVLSNPPWFAAGTGKTGGACRSEETCTLADVCAGAGWLLRSGGRFALVHRPERLADIFAALRRYNLEPKRLQPVQHTPAHPPSAVLVEAVRQGRPGLEISPALILKKTEAH